MSRITISSLSLGLDYSAMAQCQRIDPEMCAYRTSCTNLKFQDIDFGPGGATLMCDVSNGQPRPIVPQEWRRKVFDVIHNLSHPSIRVTRKLVNAKFMWWGLSKQVGQWARECLDCQRSKVQRHVKAPLQKFEVPQRRFDHIHVDIVGPLPPSRGYTHLLTIVDRFTRWPEAIPLTVTDTVACARALIFHWIARFGVPADMSSDRGPQFTSQLWANVTKLLGAKQHPTTAYHILKRMAWWSDFTGT